MTREIGPELVARMRHVADSLEAIARGEVDSPQPFEPTPHPHATPGEGTSQGGCTLTAEEREAVEAAFDELTPRPIADTLRLLLERLGGNNG